MQDWSYGTMTDKKCHTAHIIHSSLRQCGSPVTQQLLSKQSAVRDFAMPLVVSCRAREFLFARVHHDATYL